MSKRVLRKIRDELALIQTSDESAQRSIWFCLALCETALRPGKLPPHQHHSDTSTEAAIAVAPKFGIMTRDVLVLLSKYPNGLTDEQGQTIMAMDGNSYRPCRVTLADVGHIKDTGERRLTKRRRKAAVWAITPNGLEYLQND